MPQNRVDLAKIAFCTIKTELRDQFIKSNLSMRIELLAKLNTWIITDNADDTVEYLDIRSKILNSFIKLFLHGDIIPYPEAYDFTSSLTSAQIPHLKKELTELQQELENQMSPATNDEISWQRSFFAGSSTNSTNSTSTNVKKEIQPPNGL